VRCSGFHPLTWRLPTVALAFLRVACLAQFRGGPRRVESAPSLMTPVERLQSRCSTGSDDADA